MHLPVILLRTFEAAARTESFSTAATELFLTPSAVSHAIRKLETQLGASLFHRVGRSLHLTPDGEALLLYVGRGFDDLRRGMEAISAAAPARLRLHCAPSFATQWLMPRLPKFMQQHPGIEIHLSAGIDYLRFQSNEFDADIVFDFQQDSGLCSIPLGKETITPVCSPEIAATIKKPSDLGGLALLDSYNRQVRWSQWFTGNGLATPAIRGLSCDRNFLCIRAAVDGLGVALESTLLAEQELKEGKLVAPLRDSAINIHAVNHTFVFPAFAKNKRQLRIFSGWLCQQLGIESDAF